MVKARLHLFENRLMFPAAHASLNARRALVFQRTLLAIRTPVA